MKKITLTACLIVSILISCATGKNANLPQIQSPRVFTVNAPVAGNYPQGLYKYPYRAGTQTEELFTQTLEWSPKVSKTFDVNTQYTATLTLAPVDRRSTFKGTVLEDIKGLPANGVKNISIENKGRNLLIQIEFETTASVNAASQIVFSDEFNGQSLDKTKWDLCPEWDRQWRSSWRDDMVSVSGGLLRLKFMRDSELGSTKTTNKTLADTWIRAGGIRTLTKNESILFQNSFGYYEARIKFPAVSGTWGAFWLMSLTYSVTSYNGKYGTEIDIIESIGNYEGKYNAALNWDGYGAEHKSAMNYGAGTVNIYDGEFHTFALDWSPSEYVFYIDGQVYWRVDGGTRFNNNAVNENPNYIKLTVESDPRWAGDIPHDFTESEMLVDYVRVYNQPQIRN